MSRHEGVSCDSCLKGNFRGRRYKCLICFDYDLCASCYEAGISTTRHLTDHPMQCILTRTDFELYYGGEGVSVEQPQSLTCPYCTKMGFTEATLQEHVTADHPDTNFEVVCPLCAFIPGGDPNHVTDDFANHLTVEHRSGPRDLISFLDEPTTSRHGPRRIPHPSRGVGGQRPRRSSGGLSPSSRDSIDPIAELLSQLSGVRRTGGGTGQSSQLQQLQMQLQLERQQVRAATRHQLDRLPRRQPQVINSVSVSGTSGSGTTGGNGTSSSNNSATMAGVIGTSSGNNNNTASTANPSSGSSSAASQNSMLLLPRCITTTLSDSQLQSIDRENANRSLFVRELVIGTLAQTLPELTQQNQQQQQSQNQQLPFIQTTSASSMTTSSSNVESSNACGLTTKKLNILTIQDTKREQQQQQQQPLPVATSTAITTSTSSSGSALKNTLQTSNQLQHQQQLGLHAVQSTANGSNVAAGIQSNQGLPPNSAISVQSLMHSVLPQSLVLPPPPVRNTGTGTIREASIRESIGGVGGGGGGGGVGTPAPGYLRGGVGPVGVTGSSRRKPVRSVDGRNQSTDPPPPH